MEVIKSFKSFNLTFEADIDLGVKNLQACLNHLNMIDCIGR